MSLNRAQYENAAQLYFKQNPKKFERFYSPTLLQTLVNAMQCSLPTTVAAGIAFNRLVANGQLQRTDGRTEQDDRAQAVAAAEATLDAEIEKVQAPELSREEFELFGSLSQRDLSARYWENNGQNSFRYRYDVATAQHGFRTPPQYADRGGRP